jgi:AraC-like DNA-binding protein
MGTITLDWLHIVALLGAIQGFLLAGVLAARRRNRTANRLLAGLMLAFTIYLMASVYYAAGLVAVFPRFFGASYPMPLLFGPLVYLYAVAASDRSRRLARWDALHFVPFLAAVVMGLPIYLMSGADKVALYQALQQGAPPLVIRVFDPLKLLSGVTYAAVTLLFLRRHRARIRDNYSSLEHVNLQWLVRLALAAAAIWVLAVVFHVTQLLRGFQRGDDVITLAVALLVYGIGYMALRQPEIFRFDTAEFPAVGTLPAAPAVGPPGGSPAAPQPQGEAEPGGSRYERSGLSDWEAAKLKNALSDVMNRDEPWRNSDLTLADLAGRLSTTPHKLSEVLNSKLAQTFYDFVNGYRVRYVQRRITDQDARNLTILSLALDAGFASKSTFNDVFKKHTGLTPSAYRRSVAA